MEAGDRLRAIGSSDGQYNATRCQGRYGWANGKGKSVAIAIDMRSAQDDGAPSDAACCHPERSAKRGVEGSRAAAAGSLPAGAARLRSERRKEPDLPYIDFGSTAGGQSTWRKLEICGCFPCRKRLRADPLRKRPRQGIILKRQQPHISNSCQAGRASAVGPSLAYGRSTMVQRRILPGMCAFCRDVASRHGLRRARAPFPQVAFFSSASNHRKAQHCAINFTAEASVRR